jgi:hypothetical protein
MYELIANKIVFSRPHLSLKSNYSYILDMRVCKNPPKYNKNQGFTRLCITKNTKGILVMALDGTYSNKL